MILHSLKEFFLIPVQFFQSATRLTYFSLGFAVIIGILSLAIMFRKPSGFDEHPTIEWTSAAEYEWTKLKLVVLVMICIGSYLIAFRQLPEVFPSFFPQE
jgi:hypothetical protein